MDRTPEATPQLGCNEPAVEQDDHPFYAASITYVDPSPIAWETAEPGAVGVDEARLEAAAVEAGLSESIASLLVIRHGQLIFERYFNGSDGAQANNIHSLSKSILSVVAGVAMSEGLFELETPIGDVLPADLVGMNGDLTVRHLLTMSGGLELREVETDYDWEHSGVPGEPSFVRTVLSRSRIVAPGEAFAYSTGLTQVLSAIIAESAATSTCHFAAERLFAPLAIDVDHWPVDPNGYHAGGHSMFLTPREVGRFGQLVLQGGAWEGRQLVPADWLAESLAVVWDLGCRPRPIGYGYLWWLEVVGGYQIWSASGAGGQDLHIIPDLDLVLVVTHTTDGEPADFEVVPSLELIERYVIPAVTDTPPPDDRSECAGQSRIARIGADGSGRIVILEPSVPIAPWSWSPDGSRIAFHASWELNQEIYTMAADGSDWQRLTHDFAADMMPAWSPDGSTIVFVRGDPADSALFRMAADGSNTAQLADLGGFAHSPTWSPDGRLIAFIRGDSDPMAFGEHGSLWVIAADGSEPRLLLEQPVGAPAWAPGGRWIAFESRDEAMPRIKVLNLEEATVTDLGPGTLPRWSPDGSSLVFASDRNGNLDLFVMARDGSSVQQLTTGPERDTLPLWSPDGRTIVYVSFEG
jgi:CubicO group peptidase (beta-lactamase class C family)